MVIVVLTDTANTPDFFKANIESASAAMENLLLAATALGLGTCWMTGPLRDEAALRRILSIPDTKEIVAVTPLGFPSGEPAVQPRHDPDLVQRDPVGRVIPRFPEYRSILISGTTKKGLVHMSMRKSTQEIPLWKHLTPS